MLASVVICTYNRVDLLGPSLQSLIRQKFPTESFELIVVDNNSTDETPSLIREVSSSSPVKMTYVFEGQQGLSFARNAGILASCGDIVVFTDDDVEADENWLFNLVKAFDSPDVACAGGPLKAVWPTARPEWLTDDLLPAIAINEFPGAQTCGEFKGPLYPWGANLAFRRSIFSTAGFFPTNLGRIGSSLLSNEEIFLCRKIERSNGRIAFAAGAIINHKVAASRLKKSWFLRRYFLQGCSDATLDVISGSNLYRQIKRVVDSIQNNVPPQGLENFNHRCFLRASVGYFYQLSTLLEDRKLRVDRLRVLDAVVSSVASSSPILSLQDQLNKRTAWAQSLQSDLDKRDALVRSLQGELTERTTWAMNLRDELAQRDRVILALQKQFQDRTDWALNLQEDLRQRDIVIMKMQKEFTDRTDWALQMKEQLTEAATRISDLEKEVSAKYAITQELEEQIEQLRVKLDKNKLPPVKIVEKLAALVRSRGTKSQKK
jgi:glycosyltransferase involved in cell wall biosynthesis